MATIRIPNNWAPRPYQKKLWAYLENGGKRAIEVAHRRWGKDDVVLHWAATSAIQKPGNYWHMLPEASQARKAIWNAVNPHTGKRRIDEAFPEAIRSRTSDQEMFIQFLNGATWQVVGSDNYNSLVGAPPVGVVFSEWSLADPAAWAYIRPILLENGGWAVFIYTPRGRNHGATFFEGALEDPTWFAEKSTAEDTSVFSPEQLAQELKEYQREYGREDGEARYRQEYLCDFNVAVVGAYYGRLMTEAEDEGRVGVVPVERGVPVDTWWDLGRTDTTAVWFVQFVGGQRRVLDYYGITGEDMDHFALMLQKKREERKWVYGRHYFPHDGGYVRQGMGGKSLAQMLTDLGFPTTVQPVTDLQVGIQSVRKMLPNCWFDREHCGTGLEALRQYRKEWDDVNKVFRNRPLHDWASHPADAFRTGAMVDYRVPSPRKSRDYYGGPSVRSSGWAA